jgi:uncharacterized membrane protein YcjF (UPF0283 family)
MLNKIIAYVGILTIFILMGFVVDIYLTFAQLNEHNSFFAYGYMMIYLLLIGFVTFYIFKFIIEFKKYSIMDDKISKEFQSFESLASHEKRKSLKKFSILMANTSILEIKERAIDISKDIDSTNFLDSKYEELIQISKDIDIKAKKLIKEEAVSVVFMTGASQKSSLDMIIVFYKNISLIRQLLAMYGYRPNSYNTVVLIKKSLENTFAAGAIEEATNAITDDITAGILGSFVGGITNGLLVVRIGNGCTKFLSLTDSNKIPLKDVAKELINQILEKSKNIFKKIAGSTKDSLSKENQTSNTLSTSSS